MSLEPKQISGGTSTATETFDPGYRYMPYERIAGKSAADILKQVDQVLQSTNIVLENHKESLPTAQFAALKQDYRRYHWQMTNESQEDRAYFDKNIRQSRILSQLYASKQTNQDRAKVLLYKVEAFQTKVLLLSLKHYHWQCASRNTQAEDDLVLFEDELAESPSTSRTPTLDSFTSWFSFGKPRSTSSALHIESKKTVITSDPAPAYVAEGGGFSISVTHFPKPPNDPADGSGTEFGGGPVVGTGSRVYRRMIVFENKDKRVEITDPRLYALEGNETYVAENTLQAMSELGQSVLNQSDSGFPSDSQISTDTASQAQSLEMTIQKFKKMAVAKE
ncbi:hypothetical protein FRC11_005196 [Ceratobasidium sp. 423]|nr:hypothetical protein FRC11_005196 [Ceratobasidium sp. 423]